jgi:hypothetical protein
MVRLLLARFLHFLSFVDILRSLCAVEIDHDCGPDKNQIQSSKTSNRSSQASLRCRRVAESPSHRVTESPSCRAAEPPSRCVPVSRCRRVPVPPCAGAAVWVGSAEPITCSATKLRLEPRSTSLPGTASPFLTSSPQAPEGETCQVRRGQQRRSVCPHGISLRLLGPCARAVKRPHSPVSSPGLERVFR